MHYHVTALYKTYLLRFELSSIAAALLSFKLMFEDISVSTTRRLERDDNQPRWQSRTLETTIPFVETVIGTLWLDKIPWARVNKRQQSSTIVVNKRREVIPSGDKNHSVANSTAYYCIRRHRMEWTMNWTQHVITLTHEAGEVFRVELTTKILG
jgi:hypothetical protein